MPFTDSSPQDFLTVTRSNYAGNWDRLETCEAVTETKRRRGLIGPIPLRDCLAFVLAMVFIGLLIGAYLTGNY